MKYEQARRPQLASHRLAVMPSHLGCRIPPSLFSHTTTCTSTPIRCTTAHCLPISPILSSSLPFISQPRAVRLNPAPSNSGEARSLSPFTAAPPAPSSKSQPPEKNFLLPACLPNQAPSHPIATVKTRSKQVRGRSRRAGGILYVQRQCKLRLSVFRDGIESDAFQGLLSASAGMSMSDM
jgi:hypothetical protein